MPTMSEALAAELSLRRRMFEKQCIDTVKRITWQDDIWLLAIELKGERDFFFYRGGEANVLASLADDHDCIDQVIAARELKEDAMRYARGVHAVIAELKHDQLVATIERKAA